MRRMTLAMLALAVFSLPAATRGGTADLSADWSDSNNPNPVTFGSWSYRQGGDLLPQVPNWNGNGTVPFSVTQPAWAPSSTGGDFLPGEFKVRSTVSGTDWQVGDVVVHTTDTVNGDSNGAANFLWTSPITGTVTISGDVWQARVSSGRDNSWSLLVNGSVVSSGASIDGHDRAHPFLFSDGTGGPAALVQHVTAGSTIDLQVTRTTFPGDFVGVNLSITGSAVPEPSSLVLIGIGFTTLGLMTWGRKGPSRPNNRVGA